MHYSTTIMNPVGHRQSPVFQVEKGAVGHRQSPVFQVEKGAVSTPRTRVQSLFLLLQPIHIFVLSFLFYPMRPETLFLSGAVNLVVYSFLLHDEYLSERFAVSPFLLYLFLSWLRIGIVPIYLAFGVSLGYQRQLVFAGIDASDHFIPGHFINLLGDWFFVAGYCFFRRHSSQPGPLQFRNSMISSDAMIKSAFFLLIITFGSRLAVWAGFPLHRLGQPYSFINAYGASAALLVLFFTLKKTPRENRQPLILFLTAVFLVELGVTLSSYMKQHVIICILPGFIYMAGNFSKMFGHYRHRVSYKRLLVIGVVCIFFISILFNYSQMRRKEFWSGPGIMKEKKPDVMPFLISAVKATIPGTQAFSEANVFPRDGLWSFFSRNDFVRACGWCYWTVQLIGNNKGKFIKMIPAMLIPRILWPEKPKVSFGRNIAVLLGQAKSWDSATTATGFSMAGCYYWAWGYPSMVIGMFLSGMMFFLTWKVFSPSIMVNPISTLICVSLFVSGIRWFEGNFDGGAVNYVIIFVCFYPLARFIQKGSFRYGTVIPTANSLQKNQNIN